MTREKVNVSLKRKSKSPKTSLHLIAFWKTCASPSAGVRNLPSELQSAWLLSVTVWFHKFHNSLSSCNCCQNVWASNVNIFSYCLFPGTTQKCVETASEAPSASALAREEPPRRGQSLPGLFSELRGHRPPEKLLNAPVFGGHIQFQPLFWGGLCYSTHRFWKIPYLFFFLLPKTYETMSNALWRKTAAREFRSGPPEEWAEVPCEAEQDSMPFFSGSNGSLRWRLTKPVGSGDAGKSPRNACTQIVSDFL